ncbi:RNA 2',3'-cyclic phosphodiesterase [Thermoproteota archaeon]
MTRLFVAVDVSEEIVAHLKELQQGLKELVGEKQFKFVDDAHLTLLFLGEIEEEKIDSIKEALGNIEFNKFELSLTDLGVFPSEDYVKVVWLGVDQDKELMDLQKEMKANLSFLELRNDREFHPHLTMARVKYLDDDDKKNISEFLKQRPKPLKSDVSSFRLYKSTLTKEGPIYEILAEFSAQ